VHASLIIVNLLRGQKLARVLRQPEKSCKLGRVQSLAPQCRSLMMWVELSRVEKTGTTSNAVYD